MAVQAVVDVVGFGVDLDLRSASSTSRRMRGIASIKVQRQGQRRGQGSAMVDGDGLTSAV
jgi:hypothetical protein